MHWSKQMPFSLLSPLDRLITPPPEPGRVAFLAERPYAHRGLHGKSAIENSRAAFVAAIEGGHGIELDVQSAMGGDPFVFHDYTLERLTESDGPVSQLSADQLCVVRFKGSSETVPRLSEILALIAGRAPILIEVKAKGARIGAFCLGVRRALEGYQGKFAIMSFNPEIIRWFHDHAPKMVRGLVVTEEKAKGLKGRATRHLSLWRAKPDFLAYDIRDFPSRFPALQRARGLPVLTWTVRTPAQMAIAKLHTDQIIFEQPGRA
jgi:glycerophosphoryl diester phosphodiesterase